MLKKYPEKLSIFAGFKPSIYEKNIFTFSFIVNACMW